MGWKWVCVCVLSVMLACSSKDPPTLGDSGRSDAGRSDAGGADDAGDADDASPMDGATADARGDDAAVLDASRDSNPTDALDAPSGCSTDRPCDEGSYCVYGGTCGGVGTCMAMSDFCPEDCPGVCGCDGRTYCNACIASRSGVDVDPDGDCMSDRACTSSAMCPLEDYCALESCDGDGVCRMRPEACLAVFDPVCACNGMTYGNACEAHRAGQAVARAGSCTDT